MPYCNLGEKPKVYFKFSGEQFDTVYEPSIAPIDVSVKSFTSNTNNYNPNGFQVTYYSRNNGKYLSGVLLDFYIADFNPEQDSGRIFRRYCGSAGFDPNWGDIVPSTLKIDNTIHCPVPDKSKTLCTLSVSHDKTILFTKTGECPCHYSVSCNPEECPNGYIRCKTNAYPGFCCISCSEIKSEIQSATAMVRGMRRG